MLFVFKLLVTPLLIGLVSLAGRRWGPVISGWLVGLPLTSAPVAVFLALDQGTTFAAKAAQGTLIGLISVAVFCLTYSWLSFRLNWFYSTLGGWTMFFAVTFALEQFSLSLLLSFLAVIVFLSTVLLLLPHSRNLAISTKPPQWETPLRMLVATAFVIILTGIAGILGPRLSGLLTPFPIFATILGAFTHRFQGSAAACTLLRGVVTGSFTFAVFFLVIASLLAQWGIVFTFSAAIVAALLIHGTSLFLLSRYIAT